VSKNWIYNLIKAIENKSINYQAYLTLVTKNYEEKEYDIGTITNKDILNTSSSILTGGKWQTPVVENYEDLNLDSEYFTLKADSDDRIHESEEWNNVIKVSIEIVNNITLGTTGEDKIIGTSERDFIRGLQGNDAIDGGGR
jgi:RTX calcium-binding nonapeptide repeat (4 copies)